MVADCIEAESISIRRVMAGSVCIRGEVLNSDLVATGDITVDSVVGGRLCAGGNISAKTVGDDHVVLSEELAWITSKNRTTEGQKRLLPLCNELTDIESDILQECIQLAEQMQIDMRNCVDFPQYLR